jgi:hypothetical protein
VSSYRTADDANEEYTRRMGEPLGLIFGALWQELTWLHVKWGEYVELFGKSFERVDF